MRHPDGYFKYLINGEVFSFNEEKSKLTQNIILPTDPEFADKWAEEPMRLLRLERDRLITATDWWVLPDRTPTQAQLDYRQALRDITTQTPSLDENGQLTGVTWPEKPAS